MRISNELHDLKILHRKCNKTCIEDIVLYLNLFHISHK